MPFLETCAMEEWVRTLSEYERGHRRVSELCERNGKSRDIFYVWLERRWSGGAGWFRDRSQSRRSCPHSMLVGLEAAIVDLQRRFPHFGPREVQPRPKPAQWLLWLDRPGNIGDAAGEAETILGKAFFREGHCCAASGS